ncbi:MAG: hypothetical protein ACU85U_20025 [Gammaproteobacteria bacterium]
MLFAISRDEAMKIVQRLAALLVVCAFTAAAASDSIELADGTVLEGDFVGSSNGIIMFNTGDGIEAYPEDEVVGVFFGSGVETAQSESASATVTIPAGTRLVIRTVEGVDSRRHAAGHRFRGQLESALVVDGQTVVPRGAFVHARIAQSQQSGRMVGSSSLTVEFTDIMLDDRLYPIATGELSARTEGEAARTLGRTARAAAIGGLIDGSSGARTGAKVGAGASLLTSGASINVPRGTIVETTLRTPLTVPTP